MDILNLVNIAILIAFTAFFVVSEFAIVKVRTSRIDQLIEEGNKNAIAAKKVITNLDEYLSACQLGITVTALGIGWLEKQHLTYLNPVLNITFNSKFFNYILFLFHCISNYDLFSRRCRRISTKNFSNTKSRTITLLRQDH